MHIKKDLWARNLLFILSSTINFLIIIFSTINLVKCFCVSILMEILNRGIIARISSATKSVIEFY